MLKDFKDFLIKWNAVDLAVWFMFGWAFATVIKSLVDNVIMPPIGLLMWKVDFSALYISLDWKKYESIDSLSKAWAPAIKYWLFINNVISFVILGFILFLGIRILNKLKKDDKENEEKNHKKTDEVLVLEDIRNLLIKQNKKTINK